MCDVDKKTQKLYEEIMAALDADACQLCGQIYGQSEKDKAPEATEEIVCQHYKRDEDNEIIGREGRTCQGGFSCKRKHEKETPMQTLVVTLHTVPSKRIEWDQHRRARVRGEDKYRRKAVTKVVEAKTAKYDDTFRTGSFHEVLPYVREQAPHIEFKTLKEAATFAVKTLKLTLTKSKVTGQLGVEVFDQPATSYKIQRGIRDSVEEVDLTEIQDEDEEGVSQVVNQKLKEFHVRQLQLDEVGPEGNPLKRLLGKSRAPPKLPSNCPTLEYTSPSGASGSGGGATLGWGLPARAFSGSMPAASSAA